MKQWIAISIAVAFATSAAAQVAAPRPTSNEKQKDVQSVTQKEAPSSVNTQKTAAEQAANVKASKEVARMTTEEKNAFAREINRQMVNPEAGATGGVAGVAAQQKANTEISKGEPRQKQKINTLGPSANKPATQ